MQEKDEGGEMIGEETWVIYYIYIYIYYYFNILYTKIWQQHQCAAFTYLLCLEPHNPIGSLDQKGRS